MPTTAHSSWKRSRPTSLRFIFPPPLGHGGSCVVPCMHRRIGVGDGRQRGFPSTAQSPECDVHEDGAVPLIAETQRRSSARAEEPAGDPRGGGALTDRGG